MCMYVYVYICKNSLKRLKQTLSIVMSLNFVGQSGLFLFFIGICSMALPPVVLSAWEFLTLRIMSPFFVVSELLLFQRKDAILQTLMSNSHKLRKMRKYKRLLNTTPKTLQTGGQTKSVQNQMENPMKQLQNKRQNVIAV